MSNTTLEERTFMEQYFYHPLMRLAYSLRPVFLALGDKGRDLGYSILDAIIAKQRSVDDSSPVPWGFLRDEYIDTTPWGHFLLAEEHDGLWKYVIVPHEGIQALTADAWFKEQLGAQREGREWREYAQEHLKVPDHVDGVEIKSSEDLGEILEEYDSARSTDSLQVHSVVYQVPVEEFNQKKKEMYQALARQYPHCSSLRTRYEDTDLELMRSTYRRGGYEVSPLNARLSKLVTLARAIRKDDETVRGAYGPRG